MDKSSRVQRMTSAWDHLVEVSKHRSRFFFHLRQPKNIEGKDHSPAKVLRTIRALVEPLHLIYRPIEYTLYRARVCDGTWDTNTAAEFLAPPPQKASAGRMNPAGVSYLYLAEEPGTALAEVVQRPPCRVAIASFQTRIDLDLLDLTALPSPESGKGKNEQDALHFLHHFRESILFPVEKGQREHIDYVPSQIVCEFLAQVHEMESEKNGNGESWPRLHGLRYQSVLHPGGFNVVLFPSSSTQNHGDFGELVERVGTEPAQLEINTWSDLVRHIAVSFGIAEGIDAAGMVRST